MSSWTLCMPKASRNMACMSPPCFVPPPCYVLSAVTSVATRFEYRPGTGPLIAVSPCIYHKMYQGDISLPLVRWARTYSRGWCWLFWQYLHGHKILISAAVQLLTANSTNALHPSLYCVVPLCADIQDLSIFVCTRINRPKQNKIFYLSN